MVTTVGGEVRTAEARTSIVRVTTVVSEPPPIVIVMTDATGVTVGAAPVTVTTLV
jgi:hypothetical protein